MTDLELLEKEATELEKTLDDIPCSDPAFQQACGVYCKLCRKIELLKTAQTQSANTQMPFLHYDVGDYSKKFCAPD